MRQLKITQSYTNPETQAVEYYLNELGKIDLINAEEEEILTKKIRQGDHGALERLTKTNLRFVVSVAKKYQNQGLPLGDLISEGNLGLIRAAKMFDETKGFKFISYAVWWIRQSMLAAIAEHSRMIRLPLNQVRDITKMNKALAALEQQMERKPTLDELAEFMHTSEEKINEAYSSSQRTASYDAPVHAEQENRLLDVLQNEDPPTDHLLTTYFGDRAIRELLTTLTSRDRDVIRWSFGLDGKEELSSVDIAPIVGLTSVRVRQIRNNALNLLRQKAKEMDFLEVF